MLTKWRTKAKRIRQACKADNGFRAKFWCNIKWLCTVLINPNRYLNTAPLSLASRSVFNRGLPGLYLGAGATLALNGQNQQKSQVSFVVCNLSSESSRSNEDSPSQSQGRS